MEYPIRFSSICCERELVRSLNRIQTSRRSLRRRSLARSLALAFRDDPIAYANAQVITQLNSPASSFVLALVFIVVIVESRDFISIMFRRNLRTSRRTTPPLGEKSSLVRDHGPHTSFPVFPALSYRLCTNKAVPFRTTCMYS